MKATLVTKLCRALGIRSKADPLPNLATSEIRERIAASGLFDAEFYLSTYGTNVSKEDPLGHFLSIGLARGYLPSERFDPVLYRLAVPGCRDSNPLLHYIHYAGERGPELSRVIDAFPDLIAKHAKKTRAVAQQSSEPPKEKVERYMENLGRVAEQREIRFVADNQECRILVPPMSFFLERFRAERPFAFARLPHGFWDALVTRESIARESRLSRIPEHQRYRLADRIAREALPHHGGFTEALMDEMSEAISRHKGDPDFLSAVAFKGFFDATDGLFRTALKDDQKAARLRLYLRHFGPEDNVLDATVWKRYADSGQLWNLADVCRERHVVLLGPDYLGDLGRRWNLERYAYVEIARSHSQRVRWQVLQRLKDALSVALAQPGPRPVLLTMCGGSFAYWLFSALFAWSRDAFYVDLGQSIRIWFPEVETNSPWMNIYLTARKHRLRAAGS